MPGPEFINVITKKGQIEQTCNIICGTEKTVLCLISATIIDIHFVYGTTVCIELAIQNFSLFLSCIKLNAIVWDGKIETWPN